MKRSASEIIRSLEMRIARLEKQSATPLLVSSGKNYLVNDLEYKEESTKRQIMKEIEQQMLFDYNSLSIKVKKVALVEGGVKFEFTGSASVPAKVIPMPFSEEKVIQGLVKIFGVHTIDMGENLYVEPDENSAIGKIYWENYEEAQPVFFDLRLEGSAWNFTTDLMTYGIFSKDLEKKLERGHFGFSASSTGKVKEDIALLKPLLKEAIIEINRSKG